MKFNKSLRDYLLEYLNEQEKRLVVEGIDFDEETRQVSYNPSHELNVDTGENNPTVKNDLIGNVEVWSIFKRKSGEAVDGNPLLYAMQRERGWKFKSKKDESAVHSRIEAICRKFVSEHPADIGIIVPSRSPLNRLVAGLVKKHNKSTMIIDDLIWKLTVSEVREDITALGSKFRETYKGRERFLNALKRFDEYCARMKDGYFRIHYIADPEMTKSILNVLKVDESRVARYIDAINDRSVLIIDDTINRGSTVTWAVRFIEKYYNPKSITVLTLFSPLY